jgi:hypothetical protein
MSTASLAASRSVVVPWFTLSKIFWAPGNCFVIFGANIRVYEKPLPPNKGRALEYEQVQVNVIGPDFHVGTCQGRQVGLLDAEAVEGVTMIRHFNGSIKYLLLHPPVRVECDNLVISTSCINEFPHPFACQLPRIVTGRIEHGKIRESWPFYTSVGAFSRCIECGFTFLGRNRHGVLDPTVGVEPEGVRVTITTIY